MKCFLRGNLSFVTATFKLKYLSEKNLKKFDKFDEDRVKYQFELNTWAEFTSLDTSN